MAPCPVDVLRSNEVPVSAQSIPTFLVSTGEQQELLDQFQRRRLHFSEGYYRNKALCFSARAFQKTHPSRDIQGKRDADVTLATPVLLGICDGVSQIEDLGLDSSELPRELLQSCENLAASQLMHKSSSDAYQGPISLLKEAYEDTSSLGSTSVLLAVMDNTTQIHGKFHPMVGVVTLGDCELVMLRRTNGLQHPLQVILHTEKQRIGGNKQTPLQLARMDSETDPDFEEEAALDAIERGTGLHCMSTNEGDVLIMGSDGIFDNLFLQEVIDICNQFLQPGQTNLFSPASADKLEELARCLVQTAHSKSGGRAYATPVGVGGKADDTSVVVAEVVEWTPRCESWARSRRAKRQSNWLDMFACASSPCLQEEDSANESEDERQANSCTVS